MAFYRINIKRRVIEIHFDESPDDEIKAELRANRWHYQKTEGRWSKEITDINVDFAERICTTSKKISNKKNDLLPATNEIVSMKEYVAGDSVFINNRGVDISFEGAELRYTRDDEYKDFFIYFKVKNTTGDNVTLDLVELQINGFIVELEYDRRQICKDEIETIVYKVGHDNVGKLDIKCTNNIYAIKMKLACYIGNDLIREKGIAIKPETIEE